MFIGIVGVGFVGNALKQSFKKKNLNILLYDKYKNIGSFEEVLKSDFLFLCLPTNLNKKNNLDKNEILDICDKLNLNNFDGLVIIKSTIEPNTINILENKFKNLKFIHNPEFLTARTAEYDFHNQKHIVIGKSNNCSDVDIQNLSRFYNLHYPDAEISICSSNESESMKLFCNSFYSVKIQFFNELYDFCIKNDINFNKVRKLMLKNDWINPMHTNVPGPDGKLSYSGMCLPKDSEALLSCMKDSNAIHDILKSSVNERNIMRKSDNEYKNTGSV